MLGDRILVNLYDLHEGFIRVRYAKEKLSKLSELNLNLEVLRHQTRLLYDFQLISVERYEFAFKQINEIGSDLGGWLKHQQRPKPVL